jgi:hypothetical protein
LNIGNSDFIPPHRETCEEREFFDNVGNALKVLAFLLNGPFLLFLTNCTEAGFIQD